jgi:dinuclear metal center YbgI/SA1388 family protein
MTVNRDELVKYLNEYLKVADVEDVSDNGLQVEGVEEVTRAVFAVDACGEAFRRAGAAGAQMVIAHHGLFWGKPLMVKGPHRERLALLLNDRISLYASHLPLDIHPEVGNNTRLLQLLGLNPEKARFGEYHGNLLGVMGRFPKPVGRDEVADKLEQALASPMTVLPFGPDRITTVGVISGGAAGMAIQAGEAGADLYLTGEPSHSAYHQIAERKLNVIYGGHYATETLGLKALAAHLSDRFDLKTEFLDIPTGF